MQPSPFQPRLKPNSPINPGTPGSWNYRENVAFYTELADSLELDIGLSPEAEIVSHIPDMWARPLLVQMILSQAQHPLHAKIKAQWRGMLAAIALAEVYRFKLTALPIDLQENREDAFLGALRSLIPSREKTVYANQTNPWLQLYVFIWEKRLHNGETVKTAVGMTSPLTLVCPSEMGDWSGLPWYQNQQLKSPLPEYQSDGSLSPLTSNELTNDDKIQLKLWLEQLYDELNLSNSYTAQLRELILAFQQDIVANLKVSVENQQRRNSTNLQYFQTPLRLGNIATVNNPIGAKVSTVEDSSLLIHTDKNKTVLFIPDDYEDICRVWQLPARDIWVYDRSLATFDFQEFRHNYPGEYLTPQDIFLDEFYFLKGSHSFLRGGILPEGAHQITYREGNRDIPITPLLPLKPQILQYFSTENLNSLLEINLQNRRDNKSGIVISLKLKLAGGEYTISKDYEIKPELGITNIPFLEVWPYFKVPGWQEYYTFYLDDRTLEQQNRQVVFVVDYPGDCQVHQPEGQNFQIIKLSNFPDYLICRLPKSQQQIGVILLPTPPQLGNLNPNETWKIGVDFGTSFTNIYYNPGQNPQRLTLSPLNLQVTAVSSGRLSILYKYFISGALETFPLSSVLTTLGATGVDKLIFDGRVYIPQNISQFKPTETYIKTDLKWSTTNLNANKLFLRNLSLLITAEAASKQIRKIEWAVSYPSAFSLDDQNTYYTTWRAILKELTEKTGIEHQWQGKLNRHFRTEALALAQYFADYEDNDLLYTTCIDMGGGTSDISIWQGNSLIHQCSIQLAGRNLFAQFARRRVDFLNEQFGVDLVEVASYLQPEPFYVTLDAVLINRGETWLTQERPHLLNHPDLNYITGLSTLGIAGLYYYIGKILAGLYAEGKYSRQENTPVYIGGNGSRILNWLSPSGEFNAFCEAYRLFSRMLSAGSNFVDHQEETILSRKPKDEVACGLVYHRQTRLRGLDDLEIEQLFAAENCQINGVEFSDLSRLQIPNRIESFTVADLTNLKDFVHKYHQALLDLNIKKIKPLYCYDDDSQANQESRKRLWRKVKRRVDNALLQLTGNRQQIRLQPTFVIGLNELLKILNTGNSD